MSDSLDQFMSFTQLRTKVIWTHFEKLRVQLLSIDTKSNLRAVESMEQLTGESRPTHQADGQKSEKVWETVKQPFSDITVSQSIIKACFATQIAAAEPLSKAAGLHGASVSPCNK